MANFIGNNDFRGYLAYGAQNGDSGAQNALNYVGNDYTGQGDTGINVGALNEYNQAAPNATQTDADLQAAARQYLQGAYGKYTNQSGSVLGDSTGGTTGSTAGIGVQRNNIGQTAGEAADTYGGTYGNSILDFVNGARSGQHTIDNEAIQNELSKRQGTSGILGMVGRGIRSAGVTLANRNAGDSSAGDAFARAYSELGQRQLSDVGSQYALGNNKIAQEQGDLNTSIVSGKNKLDNDKNAHINDIVSTARNNLASLDAQIAAASLPDRINIEAEKEKIKADVISRLQAYDQQLSSGVSSIAPSSHDDILSKVGTLAAAGTAPENPFNFTSQTPAQLQGNGPTNLSLPIYTTPRKQLA